MLTPVEIQGITFKTGRGYRKDDVDSFMKALYHDYEIMYKENQELKERIMTLSDGIQYYKNLEQTLQKALVLAEKTSEETREAARKQAETIEHNAKMKAEKMLYDARKELDRIDVKTQELIQNFELYKAQYKQILSTQMEFVQSCSFEIKKRDEEELNEQEPEAAVSSEIKKALDVDKTEVKSAEEEALQEQSLAKQVKFEQIKVQQEEEKELEESMEEAIKEAASTENKTDSKLHVDEESEQRQLEEQLASSIEEFVNDPDDSNGKEKEVEKESDLEIRMLQKLLNEIKKTNDSSTSDEEFEFINADSDE